MKRSLILILALSAHIFAFGQNKVTYTLESTMVGVSTLWNGDSLNFWGFTDITDGGGKAQLPAPTIICNEGDTVVLILTNPSFEAHTIHLHGLDVDQINDGVPSTSFFVQPGQTGTYSFTATHAGNFLYHCHVGTVLHLQMGMYGAVIVKAQNGAKEVYTGGPTYTKEYYYLTNEVDKSWHDDYTSIGPFTNYFPDFFHVNGKSRQQIWSDTSIAIYNAMPGDTILVRLLNIGYGLNEYVFPAGSNPEVITSDGRPLPATFSTDTLVLAPGERYSVLLRPTTMIYDSITVNYRNMYRNKLEGVEKIPFTSNAFASLVKEEISNLKVYPNPTSGNFTFTPDQNGSLMLYNTRCELVFKSAVRKDANETFTVQESGLYFLRFLSEDGRTAFKKLIKN